MNDNKVYTPEVIESQPFPLTGVTTSQPKVTETSTSTSKDVLKPAEVLNPNPHPVPLMAVHTIGDSLNTHSRQILGQFTFTTLGAIQIGKYESGVSGDVRISPNGILGRNVNGETTFSIDGTTGDATFKGTLQAGTILAGLIIVGNNTWVIDGDEDTPRIILYNSGVPGIVIGEV